MKNVSCWKAWENSMTGMQTVALHVSKFTVRKSSQTLYRQLGARRVLVKINDIPLRTRRALLPLTLYSDSALLVLNGTSLSCNNTLLALNWWYCMWAWGSRLGNIFWHVTTFSLIQLSMQMQGRIQDFQIEGAQNVCTQPISGAKSFTERVLEALGF